jgi:hypothetical protein
MLEHALRINIAAAPTLRRIGAVSTTVASFTINGVS